MHDIDIMLLGIVLVIILLSMTLHEAMHAFMGYYLGDDTAKHAGRLTFNPLKHIDPFMTILLPLMLAVTGAPIFGGAKPVPFNPYRVRGGEWGAAFVALAGPLTNLVIAFFAFGIMAMTHPEGMVHIILLYTVNINLGFFAFNILPIPPLDGSRFLYAIAPEAVRSVMEQIERYGVMVVFAIVFVASPFITQIIITIMNMILAGFTAIYHVV